MRSTAEEAELLRQFARDKGITERTARNYRAAQRAEWVDWRRARCAGQLQVAAAGEPAPVVSELQRGKSAADEAWRVLSRLQAAAALESDPAKLAVLARGIREARRNWEQARKDYHALREQSGQLVPVENVRAIQQTAIGRLGQIWRAWPNRVAGDLLPEQRAGFFAACRKNAADWDAGIRELDTALENLLHA